MYTGQDLACVGAFIYYWIGDGWMAKLPSHCDMGDYCRMGYRLAVSWLWNGVDLGNFDHIHWDSVGADMHIYDIWKRFEIKNKWFSISNKSSSG
jgi:hypothetical protein